MPSWEDDAFCYADSSYTGVAPRSRIDPHLSSMRWTVAREALHHKGLDCTLCREGHRIQEGIRPLQVEHPFSS